MGAKEKFRKGKRGGVEWRMGKKGQRRRRKQRERKSNRPRSFQGDSAHLYPEFDNLGIGLVSFVAII